MNIPISKVPLVYDLAEEFNNVNMALEQLACNHPKPNRHESMCYLSGLGTSASVGVSVPIMEQALIRQREFLTIKLKELGVTFDES